MRALFTTVSRQCDTHIIWKSLSRLLESPDFCNFSFSNLWGEIVDDVNVHLFVSHANGYCCCCCRCCCLCYRMSNGTLAPVLLNELVHYFRKVLLIWLVLETWDSELYIFVNKLKSFHKQFNWSHSILASDCMLLLFRDFRWYLEIVKQHLPLKPSLNLFKLNRMWLYEWKKHQLPITSMSWNSTFSLVCALKRYHCHLRHLVSKDIALKLR